MTSLIIKIFYDLGIFIYYLGALLASQWNSKARAWVDGRKQLFEKLAKSEKSLTGKSRLWMHCASSGEYQQGRPFLESFKLSYPDADIIVSFFSPSGYNAWKDDRIIDVAFYLPLDTDAHARRLIKLIKPSLVVFVKNEFWFNLINNLCISRIPVVFVSSIFDSGHHIFLPYFRVVMKKVDHIFVQNEKSKRVLLNKDFINATVAGDTRIDYIISNKDGTGLPKSLLERRAIFKRCIVYGSVWKEDMKVINSFISKEKNILHIVVPHDVGEHNLRRISKMLPSDHLLFSSSEGLGGNVVIVDKMGILRSLYAFADLAYVGGGFSKGIHNILEPAIYYIPILFGPNFKKFPEAGDMLKLNVASSVSNSQDFEMAFKELLNNKDEIYEKLKIYFEENKGATKIIMDKLKELQYA